MSVLTYLQIIYVPGVAHCSALGCYFVYDPYNYLSIGLNFHIGKLRRYLNLVLRRLISSNIL